MEPKSLLKIRLSWTLMFSIFYLVAAGALLLILVLSSFEIVTVGFLGVLSFVLSFGLFRMKKWAVWLGVFLFFPELTFGLSTLYFLVSMQAFYSSVETLLLNLALIFYVFLCSISLTYVVTKRENFQ